MAKDEDRRKVTLAAVAQRAGVGSATVDRVINERGNVREAVRKRVLEAARELGLKRILPVSHHRMVRIDVVLARPNLPLIHRMGIEFGRIAQRVDRSVVVLRTHLEDEAPATIAAALKASRSDAIIVYAQDHALIRTAIAELRDAGRPVVTIISDLPGSARLAYAGTDHYKAGRSAGYFLARMCPSGDVIVLCNHLGFQSHAQRLNGLREQLAQAGSSLRIAAIVEGWDDDEHSEVLLREAFRSHPDTAAIYNVGAANRGVAAALRAGILRQRPVFIGHELNAFTRAILREGLMTLAIDQSPELQALFALDVLMHHFGYEGASHVRPPYVSTVPIVLYGPENLPEITQD